MKFSSLKFRLLVWLAPGLVSEVDRLRWLTEAMHDLLVLKIPYEDVWLDHAFCNARDIEPDMMAGKATIQVRQARLLEIFRRSK